MENNRPAVLITGASGFVGRHLTPALEGNGWTVRRAMRTPVKKVNDFQIETVGRATDWRAALADTEAVVHLAARVHRPNEENAADLYSDVNIEGTLHLARCAAKAGVRNFVFVSTILVNGRSSDGHSPFSENDMPTPRGIYGQSKAAAEAGLAEIAQSGEMRITVIRPPLIYGAGARGNFNLLTRAVMSGIPLPFGLICNRRAFLAVQNLNSFILQRLVRCDSKFDIFLLADDEQVSTLNSSGGSRRPPGRNHVCFLCRSPYWALCSKRADGRRSMKASLARWSLTFPKPPRQVGVRK